MMRIRMEGNPKKAEVDGECLMPGMPTKDTPRLLPDHRAGQA